MATVERQEVISVYTVAYGPGHFQFYILLITSTCSGLSSRYTMCYL